MMMASLAAAQDYPVRAVSIVVPYGPGSYTDNVIRPIAVALQKELGQPVVIDNRAGANGVIGSQFAARAKADGYTLLAGSSTTLAANVGLYKSLPYDPLKDFVPVAGVAAPKETPLSLNMPSLMEDMANMRSPSKMAGVNFFGKTVCFSGSVSAKSHCATDCMLALAP